MVSANAGDHSASFGFKQPLCRTYHLASWHLARVVHAWGSEVADCVDMCEQACSGTTMEMESSRRCAAAQLSQVAGRGAACEHGQLAWAACAAMGLPAATMT